MFNELFYFILIGGLVVLMTYVEAFRSEFRHQLWAGLPKIPWFISMVLTIVSFLYMTGVWIFNTDEKMVYGGDNRHYVILFYTMFIVGAILWTPITLISIHRGTKLSLVFISLWMTALGSIGILVMTLGLENETLACVAAGICMLHHVIFDAIYWWCTWNPHQRALLEIASNTPIHNIDYENLEFI